MSAIREGQDARRANRRYETNTAAGAITVAQVAVKRLRTHLPPGLADSMASMLASDLESAAQRVGWLLDWLESEAA